MDCLNPVVGRVVYSKAGRDKGKLFIIIGIMDENFVWVADGDLRPAERPKKKRIKHLEYTDMIAHPIQKMIENGKKPLNADLKEAIRKIQNLTVR